MTVTKKKNTTKTPTKTKKKSRKSNNRKNFLKGLFVLIIILFIGVSLIAYKYYNIIWVKNVNLHGKEKTYLYIPTGSDFETVKALLYKDSLIINPSTFEWLSEKKGYTNNVKSGRYLLTNGMSNNELINLLRSGRQEPVKVTINNIRTRYQLASKVSKLIEADSASIIKILGDSDFLAKYNLNTENSMCIFIPNTYEFFWDTPAEKFFQRMYDEYKKFWDATRRQKAQEMGLTPEEVVILASIVYQETKKKDEMSRIAGVYINRIRRGMLLQADPTVIFAIGDFSIKRVLISHTTYDSPYNTYKYAGLPPGPICLPEAYVIDKVLDYEKHDYLYFCAKDDLSGYHSFAETPAQHAQNARKYHQALNRLKIR